jgi:hypothetical protein
METKDELQTENGESAVLVMDARVATKNKKLCVALVGPNVVFHAIEYYALETDGLITQVLPVPAKPDRKCNRLISTWGIDDDSINMAAAGGCRLIPLDADRKAIACHAGVIYIEEQTDNSVRFDLSRESSRTGVAIRIVAALPKLCSTVGPCTCCM